MKYQEPAFPRPASEFTKSGTLPDGNVAIEAQKGMSLRDYFAGQALAGITLGILASIDEQTAKNHPKTAAEILAITAYAMADAMLAERTKAGGE